MPPCPDLGVGGPLVCGQAASALGDTDRYGTDQVTLKVTPDTESLSWSWFCSATALPQFGWETLLRNSVNRDLIFPICPVGTVMASTSTGSAKMK